MKNPFKPKRIGAGYLLRWHIIPRNKWFNVYLHKFIGDDDDRACHCHSWDSFSIRLKGDLREHILDEHGAIYVSLASRFAYRPATHAHRLSLIDNKPAWTLFITGPRKREWGFHCKNGWQHWSTMTTPEGKTIGGCE